MRINKYLASCKLGSRRKVEEYVAQGLVTINGKVAEMSSQVNENDVVCYRGKQLKLDTDFVYYILNKPIGYLCTVSDDRGRPTVLDIVKDDKHRIFPVGRLDFNTEGLLILTNDGDFANKVIHPRSRIGKTYQFTTKVRPTIHQLKSLRNGVMLDDGITQKAVVSEPYEIENGFETLITIYEGRNRQIRRMCEKVGLHITHLKRVAIGGLELDGLPLKKYRKVTINQLNQIFM